MKHDPQDWRGEHLIRTQPTVTTQGGDTKVQLSEIHGHLTNDWQTVRQIMSACGRSKSTVQRVLPKLEERGEAVCEIHNRVGYWRAG